VSSGAANKPYTAWSTYGSSKAAINHLSAHFATEEQDITSITIAPGRVNTEMQAILRAQGKDTMAKAQYDTFVEAFEQGTLLKPEQPGNVIAGFVAEPSKELSGKSVKYDPIDITYLDTKMPIADCEHEQLELTRDGGMAGVESTAENSVAAEK
jgi:NAD(P)-dependent dehydrogenase (short-subunit alcohol dehydrogenase family)